MAGTCRLTVLMPVFNGEKYIREAIDSILNQTYEDFIFLIIDDGSTDTTADIIHSYHDERIRYVKNNQNIGIVKTLNRGIDLSDTEFIARMDADDISIKDRFSKQIIYLDSHPNTALVGGSAVIINEKNRKIGKFSTISNPTQIKMGLFFSNVFIHSTVMFRKSALTKKGLYYDINHVGVEDYGLWFRMSRFYNLDNLDDIVLYYRMNTEGITVTANRDINKRDCAFVKMYRDVFKELGISMNENQAYGYRYILTGRASEKFIKLTLPIFEEIKIDSCNQNSQNCYNRYMSGIFRGNCLSIGMKYGQMLYLYRSSFWNIFKLNAISKLKYFIKQLKIAE